MSKSLFVFIAVFVAVTHAQAFPWELVLLELALKTEEVTPPYCPPLRRVL